MQKVLKMVGGFALGAVILVGIFALGIWQQSLSKGDDGLAPVVVIPSITPAVIVATNTPEIVATEDEDAKVWALADGVIVGDIHEVIVNMGAIVVKYEWARVDSYNVGFAEDEMGHLACVLRDAGYAAINYQFEAQAQYNDGLGNLSYGDGLTVRFMPDIIAEMNCESTNYFLFDLPAIAQYYGLAEGLR